MFLKSDKPHIIVNTVFISSYFKFNKGTSQEDQVSECLFIICLEILLEIMKKFKVKTCPSRHTLHSLQRW